VPLRLDTARGLLGYGLICAVIAAVLAALLVPEHFVVSTSRVTDMAASLRALDHGAPPLLKLVAGKYYPAGATDDQGIYVFVPLLAKLLGLSDPVVAMKWLWLMCFVVPVALYPLVFKRLFGSDEAALIAPWALMLLVASFGYADIYWIQPWAIVALIPFVLYVRERQPRRALVILALVALGASFASSIRSQAGLPAVIAALAVLALYRDWRPLQRGAAMLVVILCYLVVTPIGLSALRSYRDHWVDQPHFAQGVPTGHPFWHNTYIGLGYLPNRWDIQWKDTVAANSVQRIRPGTQYVSKPYENTLRQLYFNVWKDDAGFVVGETFQKLLVLLRHTSIYLGFVLLTVPALLAAGARRARFRAWLLLLAPALVITAIPPLITVPYRSYELGFYGSAGTIALLVIGEWAAPAWATLRRLRPLDLRAPRAAAAISVASLVALVACFVVAGSIQDRATRWIQMPLRQGPLP
jgi:hypothetical protein